MLVINMLVLGNPATSFSILIGSIPSDPLYVLSANQQRLYERCYTSGGKYAVTFDHQNIRYRHPVAFKAQIAQFAIIFST